MQTSEAFINHLIRNHYKTSQEMAMVAVVHAMLAIGAFLGLPVFLQGSAKGLEPLLGILGGGILGALGYSPAKEFLDHRSKARDLEAVLPLLRETENLLDIDKQQQIKESFLKLIDATLSVGQ